MYISYNAKSNAVVTQIGLRDIKLSPNLIKCDSFKPVIYDKRPNVFLRYLMVMFDYLYIKVETTQVIDYYTCFSNKYDYVWLYSKNTGIVYKVYRPDTLLKHYGKSKFNFDGTIDLVCGYSETKHNCSEFLLFDFN